ncbi:neuromedin-B receptor-like [Periplaneta americana]|uniref:neuromedin-B receptor-like n=1 Tax=Periplaneta americana TaxID=6978 RepID=UPI0037E801DD
MSRHGAFILVAMWSYLLYTTATTVLPSDTSNDMDVTEEENTSEINAIASDFATNDTDCQDDSASFADCKTEKVSEFQTKPFIDISSLQVDCAKDVRYDQYYVYVPHEEPVQELTTMASEIRSQFQEVIKSAMIFACLTNDSVGQDTIDSLNDYVQKCTEFVEKLKLKQTEIEIVPVFDSRPYQKSITDAQSVIFVVQQFRDLVDDNNKIVRLQTSFYKQAKAFDQFNKTAVWENITKEQKLLLNIMTDYVQKAGNLSENIQQNHLSNIFVTKTTSQLIDVKFWEKQLHNQKEIVALSQGAVDSFKDIDVTLYVVEPIVGGIVFVFSIIGNAILLLIFIRHKEMRTLPNLMVINLAFVDCLAVVLALPVDLLRLRYRWQLGLTGCKIFFFIQYMCISVSTYSVVMISVQRFMAVRDVPMTGKFQLGNKAKAILMLITVWLIGCIVGIPHAIAGDVICDFCVEVRYHSFGMVSTIDLFTYCIIPTILLAVFSGLAAVHIKRSVLKMPGEGTTGLKKLKHDRMLAFKVLLSLVILYFFGYVFHFLLIFLHHQLGVSFDGRTFILVNVILFCIRNLSICLNPVALYIMSKSYRVHFNKYLPLQSVN